MRIVQQSVPASYCHFPSTQLLLPAPRIAGLLAAPASQRPPDVSPFIYNDPRLEELTLAQRDRLYDATRILLDVVVTHLLGKANDHALNTTLALFRRAVTGKPMRPMTPAQYNANADVVFLEWAAEHGLGIGRRHD